MSKVYSIVDKVLNFLETYVCAVLFFITCAILLIQVVFRALGLNVAWTEEIARYLNIWVIYLASSKAVKMSKHMSVEIVPLMLKGKARTALAIFSNLITMVFFVLLVYFGFSVLNGMMARPQFSAANHINLALIYAAPAVGAVMMCIREIEILVALVKEISGKGPEEGEVTA